MPLPAAPERRPWERERNHVPDKGQQMLPARTRADIARLWFGATKWDNPRLPARDSLSLLVLRRHGQPGRATVADGQLTLVTHAGRVISGTPFGKAHRQLGLKRGTFTIFEHVRNGQTARRFTGNWNCG